MPARSKAQSRMLNATKGHAWVKRHHFDNSTEGLPEHLEKGGKVVAKHGSMTGKIRHSDMVMLHGSKGHGKKDPLAHASHHAANKKHGMTAGLSPEEGYQPHGETECGGEGMSDNQCEE